MKTNTWAVILSVALGVFWTGNLQAGSLNPTNGPGPTMHTLEEIYQLLLETKQEVVGIEEQLDALGVAQIQFAMELIPAGEFVMGDTFQDGTSAELPLHTNSLSAFYISRTEVTKAKWNEVYDWAVENGYTFDNTGLGKGEQHPVYMVNWYDCVKWANAYSEMEGRSACYTVDGEVYRTNSVQPICDWAAMGYRLPSEAEWEKAARGGLTGRRFPWGDTDTIQHERANYFGKPSTFSYDTSLTSGYHPDYDSGGEPYTSPVGSFAPDGYGLYDMAGNIYEWCWDWYDTTYYSSSPSADPHGPAPTSKHVARGGNWGNDAESARAAKRSAHSPGFESIGLGFRVARTAPSQ